MSERFDCLIIGAGVVGSSVAREISKFDMRTCVLEKASDVCEGTSKANSGICHAGFDAEPGTLKAKLNVRGNELIHELSKTLDFHFKENGALVICDDEKRLPALEELKERGEKNGVEGLEIISGNKAKELEPNMKDGVVAALYAKTSGIVCPFGMTIAMAENANVNGVEFKFNTEVLGIDVKEEDNERLYVVKTNKGIYEAKLVINCAGVYADQIHNYVSKVKRTIVARKGEYCLFDKEVGNYVTRTIFQLPSEKGKGVLMSPTVHGNLLMGPNANDVDDKEETKTTQDGLNEIIEKSIEKYDNIPMRKVITSFAGLRAHEINGDFVIEEVEDAKNFIDVLGIESPGLTSAPAIGEYVAGIVKEIANPALKENFIATRKGIESFVNASLERKEEMINENKAYANVICRCETVTEAEIVNAIKRPLGATTVDGVKRRTRAGMGRCQSGFCLPKTMDILERELGIAKEEIVKSNSNAKFLM